MESSMLVKTSYCWCVQMGGEWKYENGGRISILVNTKVVGVERILV